MKQVDFGGTEQVRDEFEREAREFVDNFSIITCFDHVT